MFEGATLFSIWPRAPFLGLATLIQTTDLSNKTLSDLAAIFYARFCTDQTKM